MPDAVKGKEGIIEGIKEGIIDSGIARLGVIKTDYKGDTPNYLPVPQFTGSFPDSISFYIVVYKFCNLGGLQRD